MVNRIEAILKEKTRNKPSSVLYNQWLVTKEHVPSVLDSVSQVFPHYSLHDKSHSDTIINNIYRIVGKRGIKKFSAIDLWLILSSAYYHDIGMSVSCLDKQKALQDKQFADFILKIQRDASSALQNYALKFKIDGEKNLF